MDVPVAGARRVDLEIVAALVPVGENDPLPRRAVDDARVPGGTMRMAVDDPRRAPVAKRPLDGEGVDVENRLGLARRGRAAAAPHPRSDPAAKPVGQPQQVPLPARIARPRAVALVADVVGAQLVAVREQRRRAGEVDDRMLVEQRSAGRAREMRAEQEIAVAADEEHRYAGIGHLADAGRDIGTGLGGVVIAHPGLEQVAEDVQRVRAPRFPVDETTEQLGDRRAFAVQVEIGDEERGHVAILRGMRAGTG